MKPIQVMGTRQLRFKKQGTNNISKRPCPGCGFLDHEQRNANNRPTHCPAWATNYHNCEIPNNFSTVCRKKLQKSSTQATLLSPASVRSLDCNEYRSKNLRSISTIEKLQLLQNLPGQWCKYLSFWKSPFTQTKHNLTQCHKEVTVRDGTTATCCGYIHVFCSIDNLSCYEVDRIYLSKQACIVLTILPPNYPTPMKSSPVESIVEAQSPTVVLNDQLVYHFLHQRTI